MSQNGSCGHEVDRVTLGRRHRGSTLTVKISRVNPGFKRAAALENLDAAACNLCGTKKE